MDRPRFTARTMGKKGNTVCVSVRLPVPMAEEVDKHLGKPDLHTRSDIFQDALVLWLKMEEMNDDAPPA